MSNNPKKHQTTHQTKTERERKKTLQKQAQRLQQAIKEANAEREKNNLPPLSQNKIAASANIAASTMTHLIQGKNRMSSQSAFAIGRILDKSPEWLKNGVGSISDTFQQIEPITEQEKTLINHIVRQSTEYKAALAALIGCQDAPPIARDSERKIFDLLIQLSIERNDKNKA